MMAALFEKKYIFPVMEMIPAQDVFDYIIVNYFRGLSTHKGIQLIDELVVKYNEFKKNRSPLNDKRDTDK